MEFWTTLIEVTSLQRIGFDDDRAKQSLIDNCTHVTGPYWIMEGEVDVLRDDGVVLTEVAEGAVGALGGLSTDELKQVCLASYGVRL